MPSVKADVVVLGAGIVGVSAALHLQARGRDRSSIVDRLGAVAGETSFGNTGIVQTEAVFPYMFPRAPGEIARAALNRDPRAQSATRAARDRAVGVALFSRLRAASAARERRGPCARWSRAASPSIEAFAAGRRARARCCARAAGSRCSAPSAGARRRARRRRGAEALRRLRRGARPRATRRAGAAPLASRRAAASISPNSDDDAGPGGAGEILRRPVRRARRAAARRRRALARSLGRGMGR